MTRFAPVLERFFTGYLMTQRQASPNTIASSPVDRTWG